MRTHLFIALTTLVVSFTSAAQDSTTVRAPLPPSNSRKWIIGGISVAGYTGSLILLNEAWYKNYPKSSFHTFNDAREWEQMDKLGHAWSAYNLSRGLTSAWRWAGVPNDKAILLGSGSAFSYMMIIELLDAHSQKWGWSWADVAANTFGSTLFAAQEWRWGQQRLLYKFSAHVKHYGDLETRANDLFGHSTAERILKDYNAQTYWLSVRPKSFFPDSRWPGWLTIAVGYGADGMFGGFENRAYDKNGNLTFNRMDINRHRQWYLSPDIDFSKIRTNSKVLKTTFTILNMLKMPAPALELSRGKLKVHALSF